MKTMKVKNYGRSNLIARAGGLGRNDRMGYPAHMTRTATNDLAGVEPRRKMPRSLAAQHPEIVAQERQVVPPTRDRVYHFIRRAILLGEYPGGTFIEEEVISSRTGVSRTPVREAFHRLNAEQYIDLVPRKGALVRQVSVNELAGMYQARTMIEGSVIELICRNRTPIPGTLAAIIEKMRLIDRPDTPEGQLDYIGLDWMLHVSIVELCGNDVIIEMYKSLRSRYDRVGMSVQMTPDHVRKIYRDHVTLLGLLQAYDLEGLRTTLEGHLSID